MHDDDAPRLSAPSGPPHTRRATGRVVFALAWVGVQGALVLTADRRPDGAFGFRMFNESSTIKVSLYREIDDGQGRRTTVRVEGGEWIARDASGTPRRFKWNDRVRPELSVFDREIHASYGARAQLSRLSGALDDVASHVEADAETRRLLLDVIVRRNGGEPRLVRLASAERGGGR